MEKTPILAIMYDFDHTLSPRDMQEYGFIPDLGMEADVFWNKCQKAMKRNQMDQILAYMYMMLEEAKGKLIVNRSMLRALGKDVQLFDGVSDWFARVNEYARSRGLQPEHYIISSGLKEIIEGTPIAEEFKEIYAASFCYDEHGVACWPAMAVNYTSKTQFLFRVNKGVLDVTEHRALNEFMPEEKRRVPFSNMIYFGDGDTDVPCMKIVGMFGGQSIAVYNPSDERKKAAALKRGRIKEGRAVHTDLLVDGKDRFDGRVRKLLAVQHGQRHGDGNAVVAAERRAVRRDIVALDAQVERVLCEVDGAFRRFFRDHIKVALHNDGGRSLIACRGGLFDDDVVERVLIHPQAAFLGKSDAVVADGLCVARAVRDAGQILEEMKDRFRFQSFQYTGHDDRSFPFISLIWLFRQLFQGCGTGTSCGIYDCQQEDC